MLQDSGFDRKVGAGPKARVCYICGRQYMLHSFDIHVEQCRELFDKREALKPPKERKQCPPDPMIQSGSLSMNTSLGRSGSGGGSGGRGVSRAEVDAMNALAQSTWQSNGNTATLLLICIDLFILYGIYV